MLALALAVCAWATLAAALPSPAGAAAVAGAGNPLKIGVIGPFTGPSSDFKLPMLNGIQMAVDEINAGGGYLGRKLQIVQKDDQANPETGLQLSQALVDEKVVAAVGFCNTGVAMKSLGVFQEARLPLIIPSATGTPLTTRFPAASSYIFRTSARDNIQAPFVVDDLVRRNLTRVAIFADTTGYGEAGLKDVEAALAARNLQPVHVARFALGVKDMSDDMKAARAAGADAVLSYTVGPENAVIACARRAINWNVPQVGPWTLSFPSFIDGAKEAAEGARMAQTFIAEPSRAEPSRAEQRAPGVVSHQLCAPLQRQENSGPHGGGAGL